MAIFGFHFVLTLIAVTVFSKVNSRFSICEWAVIRGLYYYLLQGSLVPVQQNGKDQKRRKKALIQEDDDRLLRFPLTAKALDGVPFFTSLFWVYNYFTFALAVFAMSDAFGWLFPQNHDRNTSLIWIVCALFFFIHVLCRLTSVKLSSNELHAERNVIISFAAIFFLVAMVFVMFSDSFFDIEFQRAYGELVVSLNSFLIAHGYGDSLLTTSTMNSDGIELGHGRATSPLLFLISMTVVFTIISAIFLFPCFQYAAQYLDLSESGEQKPLLKFSLHAAFFLPMFTFLMYTKPVKVHFMNTSGISNSSLEAVRILLVVLWAAARCAVAKIHLQAFLDQPTKKIVELKQNSHCNAEERKTKITYYASYFCAAALQYFLPVFISLCTALLLKSLGAIEFASLRNWSTEVRSSNVTSNNVLDDNTGAQALEILFSPQTQKPLWTLCLVAFLGIQSVFSIIGVIFRRIDMSRA